MAEKKMEVRPVIQAIANVMAASDAVKKSGKNTFHNYTYATAPDVLHMLQKLMASEGLTITPCQKEMRLMAGDKILAVDYEFVVEHVSGDRLDYAPVFTGMSGFAQRNGYDDKASNKALMAALKYFLLTFFKIPTGDYADTDAHDGIIPHDAGRNPAPDKRQQSRPAPSNAMPAAERDYHEQRGAMSSSKDEGTPFDDVEAVRAIATDTVPYKASNGREYQMPAADAVAKLWKACEAESVSDMAFEALLAANEPWMMVQARTDLERMRATRGGE